MNRQFLRHLYMCFCRACSTNRFTRATVCRVLALCGILISVVCEVGAQGVAVSMKMDTVNILLGDQVGLTATVTARSGSRVAFPHFAEGDTLTNGVEVVSQTPVVETVVDGGARRRYETKYYITAFDSALYTIPPLRVTVDGQEYAARETLGLKVDMVPVDTLHPEKFAGPVGVLPCVMDWQWRHLSYALGGIPIVLCLLGIVVRLSSRRPLRRRRVVKPQIPPYREAHEAMQTLGALRNEAPADGGKAYYIKLTDILRRYLMRRFGIAAPEQTTDETLSGISAVLDENTQAALTQVLRTADMVKFAGQSTSDRERKTHADAVQQMLDGTRDETMEHPKPVVTVEVLSEGMQWRFRMVLWSLLCMSSVGGIALTVWVLLRTWNMYVY